MPHTYAAGDGVKAIQNDAPFGNREQALSAAPAWLYRRKCQVWMEDTRAGLASLIARYQ
jgi:hypothetical protein